MCQPYLIQEVRRCQWDSYGNTAQFVGSVGDAFSAICCLQIFRFTSSKPSKSAIASDEKFIRLHTNSFVRYCLYSPAAASQHRSALFPHTVNIHRPSRWLFICGHSPGFSHAPSQAQVRSANCLGLLQWPVNGLVPYLPFEPPVNGLSLLFPSIVICSPSLSSSSWCLMYSAIAFVFFPTVST